jgi:hypothetical protein
MLEAELPGEQGRWPDGYMVSSGQFVLSWLETRRGVAHCTRSVPAIRP